MISGRDDVDAPHLGEPDGLEVESVEHPFRFGDRGVGRLVLDAIRAMGGAGEHAEDRYQAALKPLREQAPQVVELLESAEGLGSVRDDAYLERWSVVQLLAELEHPASVRTLAGILDSPVPPERGGDPHSFSTVREEVVIRTTAVEALERLARRGETTAREVLARHVDNDQFTIRRACVQALVAVGSRADLEGLRRQLSKRDEQWLMDVRRTDVGEVPQAEGGLFLVGTDAERDEVPLLAEPTDQLPQMKFVLAKARRLAAHLHGVDERDIEQLPDGRFGLRDEPARALTIGELAELATDPTKLPEGMEPGLGPGSGHDEDA